MRSKAIRVARIMAGVLMACVTATYFIIGASANGIVVRDPLWFQLLFGCIASVLAVAGACFIQSERAMVQWRGMGAIIGSAALVVLALPSFMLSRVTVTPQGLEVREFFLFADEKHSVDFADLQSVDFVVLPEHNGPTTYMHCHRRNDTLDVIRVSDRLRRASDDLVHAASNAGVLTTTPEQQATCAASASFWP